MDRNQNDYFTLSMDCGTGKDNIRFAYGSRQSGKPCQWQHASMSDADQAELARYIEDYIHTHHREHTVGITFGCFIPLHAGHMDMLGRAWDENDRLIIGICGYSGDRGDGFLPFRDRIRLMRKIYGHVPETTITEIDDHRIGLTGTFSLEAWTAWCRELFRGAGCDPHDSAAEYTWYSGEKGYLDKIAQLYPRHRTCLLDRSGIPVSGTLIRENPERYKELINPVFREYLEGNGTLKA